MVEVELSLIVENRIEEHVLACEGDVDEEIDQLLGARFRSFRRSRPRDQLLEVTHIVFFWEGEWHMIDRRTGIRNYCATREAAEMLAIHRGK